ncbi:MAG: bifunctional diaminohydroxyphosphoribosylaminopyrimidine deaminase/5-amino-6-(5-phosphoribosylamino)uracil reductase RibD [Gemmatimonadaceae bacterium]
MTADADSNYMRRALALAERGWGQVAPNPLVGAVLVRDGEVVGEGHHAGYGEPHAEAVALAAAGERARGATAYVSLEPCAHHGKTPPCADALIAAGVRRVVAALRDPNPLAQGGGAKLQSAGIDVTFGVEEDAARELNAPFLTAFTSYRPWVTLKLALSVDGAIARADRAPLWLTGREARREVHRLRAGADAIAVGVGTVLADDPALTVRDWEPPRLAPRRVVFDRTARLPLESRLARSARAIPTTVVTERPDAERARRLVDAGVDVVVAADAGAALRALRAEGVRSLLVEGGAELAGSLLGRCLVDRLIILQAPIVLGAGALNAFSAVPPASAGAALRLQALERRALGADVMTVYSVSYPIQ